MATNNHCVSRALHNVFQLFTLFMSRHRAVANSPEAIKHLCDSKGGSGRAGRVRLCGLNLADVGQSSCGTIMFAGARSFSSLMKPLEIQLYN
jgi:hypothetical protein